MFLAAILLALALASSAAMPPQAETDVSPEATPEIREIKPSDAAVGVVTIKIDGRNFSRGAYVSLSSPAVRVVSTRRLSPSELEARLAIASKAQPGTISLYVSNPASPVAEAPFAIAAANPSATMSLQDEPDARGAPEVAKVDPPRAAPGSQLTLKVTGKNFARGVKVAFSNQAIRVLETSSSKPSVLVAQIQIDADASVGATSLFVVNPDESETEVPFEVVPAAPTTPVGAAGASNRGSRGLASQRFEVFNLGEAVSILQGPDKAKGALVVGGGKLKYEEAGKELFSVAPSEIKEIEMNTYFGVTSPVFRVSLNSGKTYNFLPASLQITDSQSIVDSLRRALRLQTLGLRIQDTPEGSGENIGLRFGGHAAGVEHFMVALDLPVKLLQFAVKDVGAEDQFFEGVCARFRRVLADHA